MKTKTILDGETLELTSGPNTMRSDFIKNLIDNYRNNQLKAINNMNGSTDAHSIHFNLAILKKFIADIETETQKINPGITDEDLGIRFYYAAYPKAENWDIMAGHPIDQTYAGKHTLVMIPTLKKADEEGNFLHYDFNPLASAGSKEQTLALSLKSAPLSSDEVVSQNHGNLIPPDNPKTEIY